MIGGLYSFLILNTVQFLLLVSLFLLSITSPLPSAREPFPFSFPSLSLYSFRFTQFVFLLLLDISFSFLLFIYYFLCLVSKIVYPCIIIILPLPFFDIPPFLSLLCPNPCIIPLPSLPSSSLLTHAQIPVVAMRLREFYIK